MSHLDYNELVDNWKNHIVNSFYLYSSSLSSDSTSAVGTCRVREHTEPGRCTGDRDASRSIPAWIRKVYLTNEYHVIEIPCD